MSEQREVSRRTVLRAAALLIGVPLASTLHSERAMAQQKASKATMKYQDKPNGAMQCGNCLQFVPPAACKVVEGAVSSQGYCIAWVKKV